MSKPGPKARPPLERFLPKVGEPTAGGCREWQGARNAKPFDYGAMLLDGHLIRAHRAAWVLLVGPIPAGLLVLHRCDNPPCVNPEHLFLGTQGDNIRDAMAKGRYVKPPRISGPAHPRWKLSDQDVIAIREAHARGVHWRDLGPRFGVSVKCAYRVATGRER